VTPLEEHLTRRVALLRHAVRWLSTSVHGVPWECRGGPAMATLMEDDRLIAQTPEPSVKNAPLVKALREIALLECGACEEIAKKALAETGSDPGEEALVRIIEVAQAALAEKDWYK